MITLTAKQRADQKYNLNHRGMRNAYMRDWRKRNPLYSKQVERKRLYDLTELQFQTLLLIQCGKCAICTKPFDEEYKRKGPHVDHNHETDKVRGLLCDACNRGIGFLQDSLELLNNATNYLGEI
jgi:hypothetical protein